MVKAILNRMLDTFEFRRKHNRVALNIMAIDLLRQQIDNGNIAQKNIAHQLGVTSARISEILSREDKNLTLGTIADVASALDKRFMLSLVDDIHTNSPKTLIRNSITATDSVAALLSKSTFHSHNAIGSFGAVKQVVEPTKQYSTHEN